MICHKITKSKAQKKNFLIDKIQSSKIQQSHSSNRTLYYSTKASRFTGTHITKKKKKNPKSQIPLVLQII